MSYALNLFTGNFDIVGSGSGSGTPGGSDTQVQFNDGGAFGGSSFLTIDKTLGKIVANNGLGSVLTIGNSANLQIPNTLTYTKDSPTGVYGLYVTAKNLNTGSGASTTGIFGGAVINVSTDAEIIGFDGNVSLSGIGINIKKAMGIHGGGYCTYGPSSTITDFYGAYIDNLYYNTGTLTITRNYALGVNGLTLNIGTGSTSGICFTSADAIAPDAAIYRDGAAHLTISVDVNVPDEAYSSSWDSSLEVPTKNAIYDQLQNISNVAQSAPPSNPQDGYTYIDTDDDTLYIYYGGSWQALHVLTPATLQYLLQEDGSSFFLQEDGSSLIAQE